jgi:hypothetical protein
MSDMDQRADPAWLLARGVPETLPVSQAVERGPRLGRSEQFLVGARDAVDSSDASWWRDLLLAGGAAYTGPRFRPACEAPVPFSV